MMFYSLMKSLRGKQVVVELKNDLIITGTLESVDMFINMKLVNIHVDDVKNYPQMLSVKSAFVRGSCIRYIHLPREEVDLQLLEEGSRRDAAQQKEQATALATAKKPRSASEAEP